MKGTRKKKYEEGRIDVVSMGCSKNLIDSERLLRRLQSKGYTAVHDSAAPRGEYVVVNTCGFIADAKEESINIILELCEAKRRGEIGQLAVMGCLSQRYLDELKDEMPEVDRWYGKFDWKDFIDTLPDRVNSEKPKDWERTLTTPPHSAYLKISEGCDRFCAFCAIPLITGRFRSRPVDDIVAEVTALAASGVKEFNIIAQDLSAYGRDLYGRSALAELVERLALVPGVLRIRLHYAYPADFPYDVLPVMARHPNVCRYLDIALQHIDDGVLSAMRRHITAAQTRDLLARIRAEVPGIHIRTTLMVGFPGETDEAFGLLLDFVREQRFERMGAFAYCEEDDTWAARHLADSIPSEVKQARLASLMEVQQEIALEHNESKLGAVLPVLIDREESDYYVGRTEFDSPEVDPEVLVRKTAALRPGDLCRVRLTEALPFELIGDIEP